jgi:hypothetical protein
MSTPQFSIRPIHVPVRVACQIVGEGRSSLYEAIRRGELTAIKAGSRTVLLYDELEARCAARVVGLQKAPTAALEARQKQKQKQKQARKHRKRK